jgi:hypothetical protein
VFPFFLGAGNGLSKELALFALFPDDPDRVISSVLLKRLTLVRLVIEPSSVSLTDLELMHFFETLGYLENMDRGRVFPVRLAANTFALPDAILAFIESRNSLRLENPDEAPVGAPNALCSRIFT